jgi:hypothetical protein
MSEEYDKYLRLYSNGGFIDIRGNSARANGYWIPVDEFKQLQSELSKRDEVIAEACILLAKVIKVPDGDGRYDDCVEVFLGQHNKKSEGN